MQSTTIPDSGPMQGLPASSEALRYVRPINPPENLPDSDNENMDSDWERQNMNLLCRPT